MEVIDDLYNSIDELIMDARDDVQHSRTLQEKLNNLKAVGRLEKLRSFLRKQMFEMEDALEGAN